MTDGYYKGPPSVSQNDWGKAAQLRLQPAIGEFARLFLDRHGAESVGWAQSSCPGESKIDQFGRSRVSLDGLS